MVETELLETKLKDGEVYRLVWLHIEGKQFHKPTLKELKEIAALREMMLAK